MTDTRTTTEKKAAMLDWLIADMKQYYKTHDIEFTELSELVGIRQVVERDLKYIQLHNKINTK